MPDGSAEPTLPINRKNRAPAIEGLPGAGRKERRNKTLDKPPADNRAWADYTPTPFQPDSYGPTPWTQAHKHMMAAWGPGAFGGPVMPGYVAGPSGMPEGDRPGDGQLPEHPRASPTPAGPTPKVWPSTPTPTPGAQPSMPYGFGVPGMLPMPGLQLQRPPNFNLMAEAARDAANLSAMAAAAAGSPETTGGSPGEEGGSTGQAAPPFQDDYSGDFDSLPSAGAPAMPPGSVPPYVPGPMGMVAPSRGSQFHGTGKCRPCAWFYKPQGCQSAQSCSYCHLCEEGELKARKKLKVAAMRMGALTPAKPNNKTGREPGVAPRTLKLNPLL